MSSPNTPSMSSLSPDPRGRVAGGAPAGPRPPAVHPGAPTEHAPQRTDISVTALQVGTQLPQDIYDHAGVLLLAAGVRVTPHFMHLLVQRGIRSVTTRSSPPPQQTTDALQSVHTQQLDRLLVDHVREAVDLRPVDPARRPRLPFETLVDLAGAGLERHAITRVALADLCEALHVGRGASQAGVTEAVREFADMVRLDFDLLPIIVGMQQTPNEYLFTHSVNVALLSMAMGAQLGMNRQQITDVGCGGLLADVGMLRVPEEIRLATRMLTADERLEILRHPAYTVDYLECINGLPLPAKFIGYQTHERMDGSGYPRRRSGMLIHQYAKIVAVADAYAAMTGPRPYRAPVMPYEAAKQILIENSRYKFERAVVRAFLDCVSLFPIGSYVELNDGRTGTVLRANPGHHTRPIIMELDADERPTGLQIDLSGEPDTRVVRTGHAKGLPDDSPGIVRASA